MILLPNWSKQVQENQLMRFGQPESPAPGWFRSLFPPGEEEERPRRHAGSTLLCPALTCSTVLSTPPWWCSVSAHLLCLGVWEPSGGRWPWRFCLSDQTRPRCDSNDTEPKQAGGPQRLLERVWVTTGLLSDSLHYNTFQNMPAAALRLPEPLTLLLWSVNIPLQHICTYLWHHILRVLQRGVWYTSSSFRDLLLLLTTVYFPLTEALYMSHQIHPLSPTTQGQTALTPATLQVKKHEKSKPNFDETWCTIWARVLTFSLISKNYLHELCIRQFSNPSHCSV